MGSDSRPILVSVLGGALLAAAWFILIDGIVWGNTWKAGILEDTHGGTQEPAYEISPHPSQPKWMWYYAWPAILTLFAMFLLNLVSPSQVSDSAIGSKVKVWVFIMITVAVVNLGGSIWVVIANYTNTAGIDVWPGISIIVCVVMQIMSGILFFAGRGRTE